MAGNIDYGHDYFNEIIGLEAALKTGTRPRSLEGWTDEQIQAELDHVMELIRNGAGTVESCGGIEIIERPSQRLDRPNG